MRQHKIFYFPHTINFLSGSKYKSYQNIILTKNISYEYDVTCVIFDNANLFQELFFNELICQVTLIYVFEYTFGRHRNFLKCDKSKVAKPSNDTPMYRWLIQTFSYFLKNITRQYKDFRFSVRTIIALLSRIRFNICLYSRCIIIFRY